MNISSSTTANGEMAGSSRQTGISPIRWTTAAARVSTSISRWNISKTASANRILRRFVPKGADIGTLTPRELQRIEDWLNNYPRKILGYKTANEMAAA
jgi:IS30 family transposase